LPQSSRVKPLFSRLHCYATGRPAGYSSAGHCRRYAAPGLFESVDKLAFAFQPPSTRTLKRISLFCPANSGRPGQSAPSN
jgi:hypothetical protein